MRIEYTDSERIHLPPFDVAGMDDVGSRQTAAEAALSLARLAGRAVSSSL